MVDFPGSHVSELVWVILQPARIQQTVTAVSGDFEVQLPQVEPVKPSG